MKKILLITLIAFLGSCTDLDVEPRNGQVESLAFEDFDGYTSYLAKLYSSLTLTGQQGAAGNADLSIINDEGFSSYLRVYWKAQELTTDEAIIAWTDAGIRDLHNHQWSSNNQFVRVLYYRIFYTISLTNDFLRVAGNLPEGLTADELAQIEFYKAEARFIRAYAYWHALDLFRNVPLIRSISSELPRQVSPQVIFEFIESELTDIEDKMLPAGQSNHAYGRLDEGAVWMLQARLYLNSEVYISEDRYADCIVACNKVINSGAYSLASNYRELFMGDNYYRTDEVIFPIVHDGLVSQTWGGTTTIIRGGIGGNMEDNLASSGQPLPQEALRNYGVPGGWAGWRTTSALVEKFPNVAADGTSVDRRAIFFTDGQNLEINDVSDFQDGYAAPKFTNLEAASGVRSPGVDQVGTDFPVFRLADAYLMLAESELQSGALTSGTLALLNELRTRAYGNATGNVSLSDVTLDWVLDERARELYLEATRRTDLIRHGKFSGSNYIWPWKGGDKAGVATSDHLNIFPIPASDLIANPTLKQNPNY